MKRRKRCKTHSDIVAHFQKRCLERIGIILNKRILKSLLAENKLRHGFVTTYKYDRQQYLKPATTEEGCFS